MKIAVMLPIAYKGGTLQAAKNIAKAIAYGARKNRLDIQVVFSFLGVADYDIHDDFADLLTFNIELRTTNWEIVPQDFLNTLPEFLRPKQPLHQKYSVPRDGANDFFDCDLWIIISDRLQAPLLPIKPYCLVIYDYLQRYVSETLSPEWNYTVGIPVNREAEHVFVTTPSTKDDLITYIGVEPMRTTLLTLDFNPPMTDFGNVKRIIDEKYLLWVTNLSFHKNHIRSIDAFERFFFENDNSDLHIAITGVNTQYFDPNRTFDNDDPLMKLPQVVHFRRILSDNDSLRSRIHIFGHTSEYRFLSLLKNAEFVFHNALNDNGSFSVIEAAYLGVPTISARYPAMEYIEELYGLHLHWFEPYETSDIQKQLTAFSKKYNRIKIPQQEELLKKDWRSNADVLVGNLTKIIRRRRN